MPIDSDPDPPAAGDRPPGEAVDDAATLTRLGSRLRDEIARRIGRAEGDASAAVAGADGGEVAGRVDVARLAHELRTPLAAIAAMAEIMRDARFGPLGDARYTDYAASICESARHLLGVVDAMLERDAGDGTRAPMAFVDLDVEALLVETVEALRPLADAAGLALIATSDAGLPRVIADRRAVRQILTNLIANAVKFTPRGGRVHAGLRLDAGRLVAEVIDTGPGLPSASAGLPDAVSAAAGGHGIGLPLSHALAAANGAHLEVASLPAGGTRAALVFGAGRLVHG